MSGFSLDTSGTVLLPHPSPADPAGKWASDPVQWSDLSPFTQGYIEALFAALDEWTEGPHVPLTAPNARTEIRRPAFRDLAPETLARIIADCEAGDHLRPGVSDKGDRLAGEDLWLFRQAGKLERLPPLTVQLGDDGKVRLAKATGEGA